MTVQYNKAVQNVKLAFARFTYADALTTVFLPLIELPQGAVVLSAFTIVEVADNGGTSCVIDIGTSGSANAYHNDLDAKATAGTKTAFTTLPAAPLPAKITVGVTRTEGGTASTAGTFLIAVEYGVPGVAHATQG